MAATGLATLLLVAVVVVLVVRRNVHRPVRSLAETLGALGGGDYSARYEDESIAEFAFLGHHVNRMAGDLQKANAELVDWAQTLERRVEEKTGELKTAQAQMIRVERMASLGKLAAVVAHEINNPLASVVTYSKLLLRARHAQAGGAEAGRRHREDPRGDRLRVGPLRRDRLEPAAVRAPHRLADGADRRQQARRPLALPPQAQDGPRPGARRSWPSTPPCPASSATRRSIEQAMLALAINGIEAMPDGGTLTIRTAPHGEHGVRIEIADTGVGMDDEVRRHIFEPFFTTKGDGDGKGLGLGLAVVYGIVQRHGGAIDVESAPGTGTRFILTLPGTLRRRERSPDVRARQADDRRRRAARAELARRAGSARRGTTSARPAAAARRSRPLVREAPQILLVDIKMPGMDGLELLRKVRETSPETTVIIMTAYASVETAVQALKEGAYDYIVKPFDPEAVSRLVKKAAERYTLLSENRELRERARGRRAGPDHGRAAARWPQVLELVDQVAPTDTSVLDHGRERHRQGARRAPHPRPEPAGASGRSSWSTAALSPRGCWRASSSATRRAPSPARSRAAAARSSSPTRGRSSSTRSATCRRRCRSTCCACSRRSRSTRVGGNAADPRRLPARHRHPPRPRGRGRRRALPRGLLLPDQRLRASSFRRCASGQDDIPRPRRSTSSAGSRPQMNSRIDGFSAGRARRSDRATPGPATSASCRTPSSGRSCSARETRSRPRTSRSRRRAGSGVADARRGGGGAHPARSSPRWASTSRRPPGLSRSTA